MEDNSPAITCLCGICKDKSAKDADKIAAARVLLDPGRATLNDGVLVVRFEAGTAGA